MPFLNSIQRWAEERPHDTAVVIAGRRLSWAELRDSAAALGPHPKPVTSLCEANSLDFAARFAAKSTELASHSEVTDLVWGTSAAAESRSSAQERRRPAITTAVSWGRSPAQRWILFRKGIGSTLPARTG